MLKLGGLPMILGLLPMLCFASGMSPVCAYSTSKTKTIFNAKYRIDKAYKAADLVVVGSAAEKAEDGKTQSFKVEQVVKAKEKTNPLINLVGYHCEGTACSGLAVLPKKEFLLLLRRLPDGSFHKVDGNGNDVCPNVFEIENNKAKIGSNAIPLNKLKPFLESHPFPIPYE